MTKKQPQSTKRLIKSLNDERKWSKSCSCLKFRNILFIFRLGALHSPLNYLQPDSLFKLHYQQGNENHNGPGSRVYHLTATLSKWDAQIDVTLVGQTSMSHIACTHPSLLVLAAQASCISKKRQKFLRECGASFICFWESRATLTCSLH